MTQDIQFFPIVIDTNVFVHILNPEENVGRHINQFLAAIGSTHELCVDDGGKISGEYNVMLGPALKNNDDITRNPSGSLIKIRISSRVIFFIYSHFASVRYFF